MHYARLAAVATVFLSQLAAAQTGWPVRPVNIVVPMAPAGTADILTRTVAPAWSTALGQPLVIENKVGANGVIGEEYVSRARPDGYTMMIESTSIATNPSMGKLSYDPRKAFIPLMLITSVPLVLAVNPQVKASTVREFVELAKRQPGALNYSSWGNGSIGQFAGENFQITAGIRMKHVPYKSTSQALSDTLAGQVDAMFPTLPLALQHLKSGKLRGLALTAPSRSPLASEIPTMAEAGYPGNEVETWFGLFMPTGVDPAILQKAHRTLSGVLNSPEMKAKLEEAGFRVIASSPEEFQRFLDAQIQLYGRVVKQANMKGTD